MSDIPLPSEDTPIPPIEMTNSSQQRLANRLAFRRSLSATGGRGEVTPPPAANSLLVIHESDEVSQEKEAHKLSDGLAHAVDDFITPRRKEIQFDITSPDRSTLVRDRINPMTATMFDKDVFFQKYVDSQTDVREATLATFSGEGYRLDGEIKRRDLSSLEDFSEWLKDLHILAAEGKDQEAVYRTDVTPGKFHTKKSAESNYSAELMKMQKVAKRLDDPFENHSFRSFSEGDASVTLLPGIKSEALPRTIGGTHYYPTSEHHGEYLREMHRSMLECLQLKETDKPSVCLEKIAEFYQYAANSHLFDQINNSLFMNITNTLLERVGMVGIPHDELDYAAMVLQPKALVRYFSAQVLDTQDKWISKDKNQLVVERVAEMTTIELPTGQRLEIQHLIPDRVKKILENPTKVNIPNDRKYLLEQGQDKTYEAIRTVDLLERKTYLMFDRELTEEDIGKITFLEKYQVPFASTVVQDQDGKLGLLMYGVMSEQSSAQVSPEGAFESMMKIISQQEMMGRAFGLVNENGEIDETKLAGENIFLSRDHTYDQLNPIDVPSIWDDALSNYRKINEEKRKIVSYLLKRAGIESRKHTFDQRSPLSRGARGLVYHDKENRAVIKTTKLLRSEDLYQMMIMELYFREPMPGFPKFLGFGESNGNITSEYEFIEGLTPLNEFQGVLSNEEIDQALENLKNFHTKTQHVHGDLHVENMQVQTIIEAGVEKHLIWFLDPCGINGRSNKNGSADLEVAQARDILYEVVLRNFKQSS